MKHQFNFNRTTRPKFLIVFEDYSTTTNMYVHFLKKHVDYQLLWCVDTRTADILESDAVLLLFKENAFVHNNRGDEPNLERIFRIARASVRHNKPMFIGYRTTTSGSYNIYQAELIQMRDEFEVRGIVNPCNSDFVQMSNQIKRAEKGKILEKTDDPKAEFYEDDEDEEEIVIGEVIEQDVRILLLIT